MAGPRSRSIANVRRSEGTSSGRRRRGCGCWRVTAKWQTGHSAMWASVSLPKRGPRCGESNVPFNARKSGEVRLGHDCCSGSCGAVAWAKSGPQVANRSHAIRTRATP
eukprot:12615901-Heterocapsa_arctica.AAC.1